MAKGEIARYEQFLLFPPCFQKACFPGASKGVIVWEWVKPPSGTIIFDIFHLSLQHHDGIILSQREIKPVGKDWLCVMCSWLHTDSCAFTTRTRNTNNGGAETEDS